MKQETIDKLNQRTDAERFGVDVTKLNPCLCGLTPRVGSVVRGHGDFGAKVFCKCGHVVEDAYFHEISMEDAWNKYNPKKGV